ncbi:hypothetical protein J2X32_003554 [Rheinheimera pacifica]|uniref:DUF2750 domain-containing protein n=1 Tax=Rheinheimera pacifica TaxID=173990 RepID=UPI00286412DE|nr:DUF2750 domain-containing protein [Rheinheimera pacifica]MDR6984899.1 hypothetical protein [Rheinheimera pacifica]
MGQAASQAHVFYKDVAKNKKVWTFRDAGGYPAPKTRSGQRSQPFWSTLSRVQKIIKNVPAYSGFEPVELTWVDFKNKWLPGLEKDGLLVGINWSGISAAGYDLDAHWVRERIEIQIKEQENV